MRAPDRGAIGAKRRLLIAAASALLGLGLTPTVALTAGANLLQDPGAEAITGGPDSSGMLPPPNWTVTGDLTVVQYGASGGFPTPADSTAIGGGSNFFAGGNDPVSTGAQSVDLSGSAAQIDAGQASATLSGDLGGYATQDDNMMVTATFLSAAGASLGALTIGPVTEAQRNGVTTLLARTGSAAIPAGTRSALVVMTATRTDGSFNDGYGDNVSLTLGGSLPAPGGASSQQPPPAPALYESENVKTVSGTVLIKLPPGATSAGAADTKGTGFIPLTQARQIPTGSIIDTSRGTVALTAASATPGQLYTAQFSAGVFQLLQHRGQKGLTDITLMDSRRREAVCASVGKQASAARRLSNAVLGLLRSTDHGRFSTRGAYSAATVRGTAYSVQDTCAGTLTQVTRGSVLVNDFRRPGRKIVLRAGHSFLALASGAPGILGTVGK